MWPFKPKKPSKIERVKTWGHNIGEGMKNTVNGIDSLASGINGGLKMQEDWKRAFDGLLKLITDLRRLRSSDD